MREFRAVLLVALIAAPGVATALEKCVAPNGKVTYVERDCPPGTASATVGSTPASVARESMARKEADRDVIIRQFVVPGADYQSMQQWLYAHGGLHAPSEWEVTYRITSRPQAGGCKVDTVSVKLTMVMNRPNWHVPDRTNPMIEAAWDRYLAALRVHQEGHLKIGREFESELRQALPAIVGQNCETVNGLAKVRYNQLLQKFRARDAAYDSSTSFGAKEGVQLVLNTRARTRR